MQRSLVVVPAIIASACVLSACGSTPAPTTTSTTTPVTTSTSAVTRNLVVTPSIRQSLLDAGAKYHSLPSTDYVGLDTGRTYYAFDPSNNTYYAAAGLNPSPKSMAAQVGTQDDGAYNLFTRATGAATWTVYSDGLGGVQGTKCPLTIPAAVLSIWNWKANSCYPPSSSS
jgi:hypothetical protein